MIKASMLDKYSIVNVLFRSFEHDSFLKMMLKSNNLGKIKILFNYIVEEAFRIGEIYFNEDKSGVVLLTSSEKEQMSVNLIIRFIKTAYRLGIRSVYQILRVNNTLHSFYPKSISYYHLAFIGVLPEKQGQGIGSQLLSFVIAKAEKRNLPIYLETAKMSNVEIYKKRGFEVYDSVTLKTEIMFFMRKLC